MAWNRLHVIDRLAQGDCEYVAKSRVQITTADVHDRMESVVVVWVPRDALAHEFTWATTTVGPRFAFACDDFLVLAANQEIVVITREGVDQVHHVADGVVSFCAIWADHLIVVTDLRVFIFNKSSIAGTRTLELSDLAERFDYENGRLVLIDSGGAKLQLLP